MPDPFIRVRLSGNLPGGEVWSVNPVFGGDFTAPLITQQQLQDTADAIANIQGGSVLTPALRALLGSSSNVSTVRVEWYTNGTTLTMAAESLLDPVAPGTGTVQAPITTAVCVSLLTATLGRSYRGRLFFPAPAVTVEPTTGRIASTRVSAIATDTAFLLEAMADAMPGGEEWVPVVESKTKQLTTPITRVRVGDVPDNISNRKDALVETSVTVNVG